MLKRLPLLDLLFAAAVSVITGIVFGVLSWHLIVTGSHSDYPGHIYFAQELLLGTLYRVHAMYQVVLLGINALLPVLELPRSAWIAVMLFYVATAIITYALLRMATKNRWLAAGGALILSIVAPITIFTWANSNLYFGYIVLNSLQNPTMIVLKPFALILFAFALGIFEGRIRLSGRMIALSTVLIALSIFAKPSFVITLLPALIVVTAYRSVIQHNHTGARLTIIGMIIPSILLLIIQYVLQYVLINVGGNGGVGLLPFATVWYVEPSFWWMAFKLVLSIMFPLGVVLLYRKEAKDDLGLALGWWIFVFGVAQMYFAIEYGITWTHGNFSWGGQIALLILFVASMMFWFRHLKREPRLWIALALLALHIISGFAHYYLTLTLENITFGW